MSLSQFDTVNQARAGLKDYFEFYNYERLHQSLEYHTPAQVYLNNSSVNPVLYQPNSILISWLFGLDIGEYLKEILAGLAPYRTEHINRYGDYTLNLDQKVPPMNYKIRIL